MDSAAPPRHPLVDELATAGKELPDSLRERIVATGEAIVPALIAALLAGGEENDGPDRGDVGWASIHAVGLLVDLRAAVAIGPLLHVLADTAWDTIIHDRIIIRLPELGAAVLEPALALLDSRPRDELVESLCSIVAKLGAKDERVLPHLVRSFHSDPGLGAIWLADYGDARAVPILREALENTVPDPESPFGQHPLVDIVEAYEHLVGPLSAKQRTSVDQRMTRWKDAREAPDPQPAPALATKVGRNDPCPCGSGKKFKRCHLGAEDELSRALADGARRDASPTGDPRPAGFLAGARPTEARGRSRAG